MCLDIQGHFMHPSVFIMKVWNILEITCVYLESQRLDAHVDRLILAVKMLIALKIL